MQPYRKISAERVLLDTSYGILVPETEAGFKTTIQIMEVQLWAEVSLVERLT